MLSRTGDSCTHTVALIRFWSRAILSSKTIAQDRFIRHMEEFLGALVEQAREREEERTPSLEEYRLLRPLPGAMYPSFEVADLIVGLPEDVIEHPLMRSLRSVISDLVLLNNVSRLNLPIVA